MALLDTAYIVACIRDLLNDQGTTRWSDDQVNKWIQEAAVDISTKALCYEKTAYFDTVANTLEYDESDNCIRLHSCLKGGASTVDIDSNTILLVHSDHADDSQVFTDSGAGTNCPHTITASGNAHHETDEQKFGASSIYFDGDGDHFIVDPSTDWNFGTGDFTIDFWYMDDGPGVKILMGYPNGAAIASWAIVVNGTTEFMFFYASSDGVSYDIANGANVDSTSTTEFHHYVIDRNGSTFNVYKDGTWKGFFTSASGLWDTSGDLFVGNYFNGTTWYPVKGYLDELRISDIVRYDTGGFTPETEAYGGSVTYDTAYKGLSRIHPRLIQHLPHSISGEPKYCYHHHGKFGFFPVPDDAYTVTPFYSKVTEDITALPTEARLLAIPYTLAKIRQAEEWEDDFEMYMAIYRNSLMAYKEDICRYRQYYVDGIDQFQIPERRVVNG